jgi:hypothetical protein
MTIITVEVNNQLYRINPDDPYFERAAGHKRYPGMLSRILVRTSEGNGHDVVKFPFFFDVYDSIVGDVYYYYGVKMVYRYYSEESAVDEVIYIMLYVTGGVLSLTAHAVHRRDMIGGCDVRGIISRKAIINDPTITTAYGYYQAVILSEF